MAQRTFSSPLRISAIADISLFLLVLHAAGLLSFHYTVGAARNSNSKRIDDGGIKVQASLPGSARHIIAIRNHPLTLQCPIIITDDVKILDMWWMKDGVKLDLYPISTNSGQQQTNSQQQPQQQLHQLQTSTQAHHSYNSNNPPSSSTSSTSSSSSSSSSTSNITPRIVINNEQRYLHFERINHKVSSLGQRHKNYSDEGQYRCVVKTPLGVVLSAVITVSVAPPSEVRLIQEDVKAKSGEPILLECQTASLLSSSSSPSSGLRFTWIRGDNVTITQELDARYNLLSSGILAISKVNRTDAGQYRCVAKNESSKHERISYVNLVVLPGNDNVSSEPPKIISTSTYTGEVGSGSKTVLILEEDENTILDCVASGIPLPIIDWVSTVVYDNETINVQVTHAKRFHNSINITTSILAHGTAGDFTCRAENGVGERITRTIKVFRLPALQREPVSYQHPPAKTVRIECKVQPFFTLVWYKDGQLLETGKGRVQVKGNELVVSNTIRNDSGFYQCEVIANDRVYAIGTARLLINNNREAPDAPTNVECLQTQSNALTVSWMPPAKVKEPIISFSIHYMPSGGEERQKVVPPRTNFTITSLLAHTEYSIYVRSYTAKAAGPQSDKAYCMTREDVPLRKQPIIRAEVFGPPNQVRLTWKPLSNKDARGKIILYKLQWRSVDEDFSNVVYIDGDSVEFVITDLSIDQNYEVRLIPSTSVGWPTMYESMSWQPIPRKDDSGENVNANSTNEGFYSPASLHLTVLNSTSVLVNWSEPPRPKEVHVKGFRITYSTGSEKVKNNDVVFFGPVTIYDDSAREFLFTNLAPGSTYEFFLQTWGEDWESAMASKFIETIPSKTGDSEPGDNMLPVITGLQVHPLSSHEVRLKWDQPTYNNSDGYFYTVKYNKVDSSEDYYLRSTRTSVEIKGLSPYTSYEFVVQLALKDGHGGPYSQKIESRTLPGVPSIPTNLHWRVHNQSIVEVEWNPPHSPNGMITKYWVEYKPEIQNNASSSTNTTSPTNNNAPPADDAKWTSKSTSNTSIFLNEMQRNLNYAVRVKAATKAGIGEPSEIIMVRIYTKRPEPPFPGDQPKPPESQKPLPSEQQKLGIMIGLGLSAVFIALCVTIIVCRNRFFPLISRPPPGALYVNGNGHPPRSMRSLESLNCVEMKVLVGGLTGADGALDTKGGHPMANGNVPSATDPLLVHVSRNAPDSKDGHDEETIPNCVH